MQPSDAARSAGITKLVTEFALAKLAKLTRPVTVPELAGLCGYAPRGGTHAAVVELERLGYARKTGRRDRAVTWVVTEAGKDAQALIDDERQPSAPAPLVTHLPRVELPELPEPTRKDLAAAVWAWMEDMGRADLEALSLRQLRAIHAAALGLDQ